MEININHLNHYKIANFIITSLFTAIILILQIGLFSNETHAASLYNMTGPAPTGTPANRNSYTAYNQTTVSSSIDSWANGTYYYMHYLFNNTPSGGSHDSYWLVVGSPTLTITFPNAITLSSVRVYPWGRGDNVNYWSAYSIAVSADNVNWTKITPNNCGLTGYETYTHCSLGTTGDNTEYSAGNASVKYVKVYNKAGPANFTILNEIQFYTGTAISTPTLTSISPNSGTVAGGTTVTLNGTGFVSGTTALFGGSAGSCTFNSSTKLTCTTPTKTAGSVNVSILNPDTGSSTLTNGYTYYNAPTVTGITPSAGNNSTSVNITNITGTNFRSGVSAKLTLSGEADIPLTTNFVSANTLTATIPNPGVTPYTTGKYNLVITNDDGQSATLSNAFTMSIRPTITSLSSYEGKAGGGTSITITGTNFIPGITPIVKFGETTATVQNFTSTEIVATIPYITTGTLNVTVTNPASLTSLETMNYRFYPAPTITSVLPLGGPLSGNTSVAISGTNFYQSTIKIGGNECTNPTYSDTIITCTIPSSSTTGSKDVVVTTPSGTITKSGSYTYYNPPTISTISPPGDSLTGGSTLSIVGTNFYDGISPATVTIGGQNCPITSITIPGTISCTIPSSTTSGYKDIIVTTSSGSTTKINSFYYYIAPTLSKISPPVGPLKADQPVALVGSSFIPNDTSVTIDGNSCTNLTVMSPLILTCLAPSSLTEGAKDIVVTTSLGSAQLSNGYTYDNSTTVYSEFGIGGSPLSAPSGLAVDSSNNLYLTDTGNNQIKKFNNFGVHLLSWGEAGSSDGQFNSPKGIAASSSGIFVLDSENNRIQKFSNTGTFQTKVGTYGTSGYSTLSIPQGIATNSISQVFAADSYNHRIMKYNSALSPFNITWGTQGSGNSQFNFPTALAANSAGYIYIVDSGNNRIKVTGSEGAYINQWGSFGTGKGQFNNPNGIAIDNDDNVYVVDSGNNRIQKFTSSGVYITQWGTGTAGNSLGEFDNPTGIAVDSNGSIYVADTGNNRIVKMAVRTASPTITNINPSSGPLEGGQTIVVTGSDFITNDTTLTIDGNNCTNLEVITPNELTCITPPGTSGSKEIVIISSTTPATFTGLYQYYIAPTITTISPNNGKAIGGDTITINGNNFQTSGITTVKFGENSATDVNVISSTKITAVSPAKEANAENTVNITVINPDSQSATKSNSFTYNEAPTISAINPIYATTAGGSLIITGNNFRSGEVVTFDGIPATTTTYVNPTTLYITVPAGLSVGDHVLTVTSTDNQQFSLSSDSFTIYPTSPLQVINPPGETNTKYRLNPFETQVITFNKPLNTAAKTAVQQAISASDGQSITYSWNNKNTVLSFQADFDGATFNNNVYAVSLTDVFNITTNNVLIIKSVPLTYQSEIADNVNLDANTTEVVVNQSIPTTVTIPQTTPSPTINVKPLYINGSVTTPFIHVNATTTTGNVSVSIPNNTKITTTSDWDGTMDMSQPIASTALESYIPIPPGGTISNISGYRMGKSDNTLIFQKAVRLKFEGKAGKSAGYIQNGVFHVITNTCSDDTENSNNNLPTPQFDIYKNIISQSECKIATGTNNSDLVIWTKHFTEFALYDSVSPPVISSITPATVNTAGGKVITINGSNFSESATLTIGGQSITNFTINSVSKITATTPAHTNGQVDIVVTNVNPIGLSDTLINGLTYTDVLPPTISNISPASGNLTGGNTITITGNNFLDGAIVTFGGTAATAVSITPNSITATPPAHSAGTVNVIVTNPDGQTTDAGTFTYTSSGSGGGNSGNGSTGTGEGMVVIDCGNLPQMDIPSNLEFDSDPNTAGIQPAFISNNEQTTHAIQPSIKITDSRTNESSCNGGNAPVTLTVKVNSITDNFCRIADGANPLTCDTDPDEGGPLLGDQKLVNEIGIFSALSFTGESNTACTGCGYYSNTINLSSNKSELTNKNSDVPGPAITLFSNPTGFNGVATLPALDYSLIIPPNSAAGTFKAAITYELSFT